METQMTGIRTQLLRYGTVQNVMNLVNKQALMDEHKKQRPRKAKGIDRVDKYAYGEKLNENIDDLLERMKNLTYKPLPVRRTYIPKLNGKMRPLGIPAYEDRLVQGAIACVLNSIYEPIFLNCSYGFRPHRSCHDAIRAIDTIVMRKNVNWVLEADIRGFFDHVNHDWLMKFLAHVIKDKRILRYIKRFLIAGIMEDGKFMESTEGTPQGGLISPILANVYLHYALDVWFKYAIKPQLKGEAYYVRYADDFVIFFQYEEEAREVMELLTTRLAKFSLEVAEEKTRILPFGPKAGTNESFDFLGFTIFNAKKRNGGYRIGFRTCKKKLKAKMQAAKEWIKGQMHGKLEEVLKALNLKYLGHCRYYGVNGNFKMIEKFRRFLCWTLLRALRRRGQKGKISWKRFGELWEKHISRAEIMVDVWYSCPMNV